MGVVTAESNDRTARWALFVLTAVNLCNYIDRYVVAALVTALTSPAPAGLGLSDTEAGWLASVFIIVYLVAAPIAGDLADRRSRPHLIAAAVALWAVATMAGAAATGFVVMLLARAAVGIGEGAYGSAAPAMLADHYPQEHRAGVFSIFYAAIPVGAAVGFAAGGAIGAAFGWRAALLVAGFPGLILAWLAMRLPDPVRGAHDGAPPAAGAPAEAAPLAEYIRLFRIRGYSLPLSGYIAYTFALGALAFWAPAYLERSKGLSTEQATIGFGLSFAVTGLLGTLLGGWLVGHPLRRLARANEWVCAGSAILAAPLVLAVLLSPSPAVYIPAMLATEVLLFVSTGPVNTALVDAVPATDRAKAMAACIVAIHLFGDVASPPLVGYLADRSSLGEALLLVPAATLVAGALWVVAAVAGAPAADDLRLARKRLGGCQ